MSEWFVLFKRKKGKAQFQDTVKKHVEDLENRGCTVSSVEVRYPSNTSD